MTKIERLNHVDPFEGQSIICLNPRTFRDFENVPKLEDLEAIHEHMSSMVLRSPFKHLEKAKPIVDGSSELLNTKESEANANDNKNPQERRPALARKRAEFYLKPDTSGIENQPFATLEPSFETDQLQDPEDFFAAYEKLENTRKEMKRQRGGEDPNEVTFATNARRRRPEISGRKVSYKHHDYSTNSKSAMLSSQEKLQDDIRNPPIHNSEQESVILNNSLDKGLAEPVTKTEKRLDELFDDLISSDIDRLDGNETLSFLKERLKIKPVDIDTLHLPDSHDVGTFDFDSPGKNLLKDQNRLSDTCTLPDGIISKTLGKQKELSDSPHHPLSSPTLSRSSFLATSTFAKRLLNSISVVDQSSARDPDSSLMTSSLEVIRGQSDSGSKGTEFPISSTLDLLAKDNVTNTTVDAVSPKVSTGALMNSSPKSLDNNKRCDTMQERDMNDDVLGSYTNTSIQTNEGTSIERTTEDIVQKAASFTHASLNMEVEDGNQKAGSSILPEASTEVSMAENLQSHRSQSDETGTIYTKNNAASTSSLIPNINTQHEIQDQPRTSINKRKKTSTRPLDPRKRRQSLADAGTSWTSGVRRSKRVKRRPLEYWKGERFLYGRVHNSLPTIIGLKYISPNKNDGKPVFKVKSFVPDKYKEILELVSLH